jgi:hypothetical protein
MAAVVSAAEAWYGQIRARERGRGAGRRDERKRRIGRNRRQRKEEGGEEGGKEKCGKGRRRKRDIEQVGGWKARVIGG